MRTAVVTIAHGRHDHLGGQLRGLRSGTNHPDLHVVVALDDPAIAGVIRAHPGYATGHATVIECPAGAHLPLARARNIGAAHALEAGADMIVFLDVDCIPSPTLVARYRAVAADPRHQDALLCGPVTYLPPAGPSGYDLGRLAEAVDPHPARPCPPDDAVHDTGDYALFWSLSFALTAPTWHTVGGFCEDYEGYGGEDTDFARCAEARGVPMRWVGGAHAFHQHHDVQKPPVDHLDDIVRNAYVFHRRWGRWPMEGWLSAFEERGLITRGPDGTPRLVQLSGSN